jgi:mRNA interferase RelE/StbE
MAWTVELSRKAERTLGKLERQQAKRILAFLSERVATLDDPRSIGKALRGAGELWRYRVGDYRLICKIEDERVVGLVLRIGHRSDVYR